VCVKRSDTRPVGGLCLLGLRVAGDDRRLQGVDAALPGSFARCQSSASWPKVSAVWSLVRFFSWRFSKR
jgi:hypothetical protein